MHPPEGVRARWGLIGLTVVTVVLASAVAPSAQAFRPVKLSQAIAASNVWVGQAVAGGVGMPPRLTRAEAVAIVLATARAQIGKPYRWASTGPKTFDCSGLTRFAWAAAGVSIPRVSRIQYRDLPHVAKKNLQPGDLVFFGRKRIHHVGIYVGAGRMINAPHTGARIRIEKLWRDFAGAARPSVGA